jgi:hypothetical protein
MAKTFPFPDASLPGLLKKASYALPTAERGAIAAALSSKTKPNTLTQKAKTLIICLMSAKESDEETFEQDLREGVDLMSLSKAEKELFDGLLGAKLSMALDLAKKGVSEERLGALRGRLGAAFERSEREREERRLKKAQAMAASAS